MMGGPLPPRTRSMSRVLLACAAFATLVASIFAAAPLQSGVRRALLIGCGDYPLLERADPAAYEATVRLAGPANDVALLRDVLVRELDFESANVRTLVGWPADELLRPTRARILAELEALRDASGTGDFVFVHFSGHGTQQPSRERDSAVEPDGLDEVLLPADVAVFDPAQGSIPGALRDDEIGAALAAIRDRGATVWFVVDACHSGSILRGDDEVRWRGLDPALLAVPRATRRAAGSNSGGGHAASAPIALDRIALFHGAQSHGRAPEYEIEIDGVSQSHGLFTWLLAQELVRTRGAVTYRELIARVVAAYQAWPCRVTVPGASGDDLERLVFGGSTEVKALLAVRDGDSWRVDAGRLAGLVPGARLALLADDDTPIGELIVDRAEPFESHARVRGEALETQFASLSAARVRVLEVPLADPSLRWALVDPSGAALAADVLPQRVREELLAPERLVRLPHTAPHEADWWLVVDGDRARLRPRLAAGGVDLFLRSCDDAPRELARIARAQNLTTLAATAGAPLPNGLAVTIDVREGARAAPRRLTSGERVSPGHEVRVRCTKLAGASVDLNVFYVDALHGLTRLFPRLGDSPRLAADTAGELTVLDWTPILDTALGLEHVLVIAQRREESEAVLDLASLEQAGVSVVRGSLNDPVARFLDDLASAQPSRAGIGSVAGSGELGFALATLDVDWNGRGAPHWPPTGVVALEPALSTAPFGFELPAEVAAAPLAWTHAALLGAASARDGDHSILLLGDEHGPRAAYVDIDVRAPLGAGVGPLMPAVALDSPRFTPDLYVRFDGDRVVAAYLDVRSRALARVFVDDSGDGLAERRFVRAGDGWARDDAVAVAWLSQVWFGPLPSAPARTAAMRALRALDSLRE